MGVIFGIFGEADLSEIQRMSGRLEHRGVESQVCSVAPRVHFGARWAADAGGLVTTRATAVALAGSIDNDASVAALLGRPRAPDGEDDSADLVFDVYQKFGPEGFQYLSGPFALALWDDRRVRLILARNARGSCPLYVARVGDRYLFASEYKALLAIDELPARPNRDAIQHLQCTKHVMPDASCLADVHAVPPGSWIELGGDGARAKRYQKLSIDIADRSDEAHAEALRQRLLQAARRQTRRFEVIGVALSGGLDSSAVVAAVHQVAPDKPLHTFTTGFDPDDEAVADAQVVARHFGTRHHESYLTPDAVPALLPRVVWHMEDPIGREEKLFLQVIAAEAAKHVPVLLMGENADSLFAGMPRHMVAHVAAKVGLGAGPLEEFYRYTQSGRLPTSLFGKTLVALYYRGRAVPAPRVLGAATMPESAGLDLAAAQPLNELLRRSLLGAPNAYAALERICGGAGLAFNAPYFDSDLVQCALQIPDRLKIRGRQQKYILRLACRSLLPDAIAQRKKGMPRLRHDRALCDVLDRLADDLLAPQVVRSRQLFDPAEVDRARRRPSSGIYGTDQFYRLWTLLLTELWARLFLDGRGARPS